MERAYRNLGLVLLALPPIFVAGFWIPYLSDIPQFDPAITPTVHGHALLLFAWIGLLVIQPLAIRSGAFSVHRSLGKASYVLMPLIAVSSAAMLYKEYHEHLTDGMRSGAALAAEFLSACQLTLFVTFYCLSMVHIRGRQAAAHMRYMICVALVLLPAGLARTVGYWFGVKQSLSQTGCLVLIDLCLMGLIGYDRTRRLPSRPYGVALALYVVIEAAWFALGRPV
jgi:hypothetical protein